MLRCDCYDGWVPCSHRHRECDGACELAVCVQAPELAGQYIRKCGDCKGLGWIQDNDNEEGQHAA